MEIVFQKESDLYTMEDTITEFNSIKLGRDGFECFWKHSTIKPHFSTQVQHMCWNLKGYWTGAYWNPT